MSPKKKRIVLYLGEEHIAVMKREQVRTGVSICEQVRRLILQPTPPKVATYAPEIERRTAPTVLVASR